MSALMPGFTRKIFEGPSSYDGFSPPQPNDGR
jgi:hypothetical protein